MSIILFVISLVALCAIIASKMFEIRVNRVHFISNFFHKGDVKIHELIEKSIFIYNRYKKIAKIFVFDFLPSYAYEILVRLKDYVAKKYYLFGNDFRGRRMLRDRGSVSNFLQHIANDKSDTSNHKA